jgi:hypothetical protein
MTVFLTRIVLTIAIDRMQIIERIRQLTGRIYKKPDCAVRDMSKDERKRRPKSCKNMQSER